MPDDPKVAPIDKHGPEHRLSERIDELQKQVNEFAQTHNQIGMILNDHKQRLERAAPGFPKSSKEFKRQVWKRLSHLAEAFSPFWRGE